MATREYDSCYKSYDIRSIYNEPLDSTFAYSLGKGIGKHLYASKGADATFVFGSDVREANNELIYRFLKGLEESNIHNFTCLGIPVENIGGQEQTRGVCSSATMYYVANKDFDMGAMFTASHNPAEYVGLKIVDHQGLLIPSEKLKSMVESYEPVGDIDTNEMNRLVSKSFEVNEVSRTAQNKITQLMNLYSEKFTTISRPLKIVVDYSNGSATGHEKQFLETLTKDGIIEVIPICEKADSTYSFHESDTTNPHDFAMLIQAVQKNKADLGVMFDGDGDRLGFVDEQGNILEGDIISGLIASHILSSHGRGGDNYIIHDVFFTKSVLDKIKQLGGTPYKSRVGHRYVKEHFKEQQALFGGELSGHLFFNEVGGFESPLMALYHVLCEFGDASSFSALVSPYLIYCKPPLVMFEVESIEPILESIKKYYSDFEQDYTDGVGVYADNYWFVIRPSNTVPVLKLVIEADNIQTYDKVLGELKNLIIIS